MATCPLRCRQMSRRPDLLRELLQCTVNNPYNRLSKGSTSPMRIYTTKLLVILKAQCHIGLLLNITNNVRLESLRWRWRAPIMKTDLVLAKPHRKRQINRTRNPLLPQCWTIKLKLS